MTNTERSDRVRELADHVRTEITDLRATLDALTTLTHEFERATGDEEIEAFHDKLCALLDAQPIVRNSNGTSSNQIGECLDLLCNVMLDAHCD